MAKIYENNLNVNVRNTFCKADFVPQSFPYFMGAAHHIMLEYTLQVYTGIVGLKATQNAVL